MKNGKRSFRLGRMNEASKHANQQRFKATCAAQTQEVMQLLAPLIRAQHMDALESLTFVASYQLSGGMQGKQRWFTEKQLAKAVFALLRLWQDAMPAQIPGYPYTFDQSQRAMGVKL